MAPFDLSRLQPGSKGTASVVAQEEHSAKTVGSGTLDVFATPMMAALMEQAAVDCVERLLPEGCTSLGTHLDITHEAATPLGMTVTASAELITIVDRELTFRVEARDQTEIIGRGTHRRVVVAAGRFLDKLRRKAGP